MKKIILAAISAFTLSAFIACSADAIANADATDKVGPTGIVSNKKEDRVTNSNKKSSSSQAKSSSSSAKSSSSSDK